jgi:hypothetical protein
MEKDFHLSLSTDMKLLRRTGRIAARGRKRNKFVFNTCFTIEEACLAVVTLHNM